VFFLYDRFRRKCESALAKPKALTTMSSMPTTETLSSEVVATLNDDVPMFEVNGSVKKRKKARYSKAMKKERKEKFEHNNVRIECTQQSNPQQPNRDKQAKKKKKKLTVLQRIQKCAKESLHTGSVELEHRDEGDDDDDDDAFWKRIRAVRISSGCDFEESKRQFPSDSISFTVHVQPLLILDLNGILCHRSRSRKEPHGVQLRSSIGTVSLTPVIPRTDLSDLLQYLDQHFCLAIWTSAKRKTAKALVDLLIPQNIRDRLLFVWGQNYCHAVHSSPKSQTAVTVEHDEDDDDDDNCEEVMSDEDVVFEKRLDKVWTAFPLWSSNTTLLIDDSPDKCPFASANAIHPPPLHGQLQESQNGSAPLISDEENERMQSEFFHTLVQFWSRQPHLQTHLGPNKTKCQGWSGTRDKISYVNYYEFLETHAGDRLGWRKGETKREECL
jgi:hypothetical protein